MKYFRYFPLIIFFVNLIIYALFNYGGIRSPDSEIVFRTTESLILRNNFKIPEAIDWENFGLSVGTDNKKYSIFGPAESIAAVPLLKLAYFLERNNFIPDSSDIPISFYVGIDDNLAGTYYIENKRPPLMEAQFVRFIISFFNSIIGALSGMFLYFILVQITRSKLISLFTTFIFSFGSLIFPYTATFFSEPLCTLFMILSFLFIIKNEIPFRIPTKTNRNYFYSGLFLGLAIVTHISAVLSVPFFYMFILGQILNKNLSLKRFGTSGLFFTIGLFIFGILLLYYNYARFGDILETGRTTSLYRYAIYSNPLAGLYGLLLSPGKGLFIYVPIVILSIVSWKAFHKRFPHLSFVIATMIVVRILFIASRSDWHGGFSLGPRYLVIILPFFFIPIAIGLKEILSRRRIKYFILFSTLSFLCIAQQLFFSIGEIFSYLRIIYLKEKSQGIETFVHNILYLDWRYSPAVYLLNYKTSPFFLKFISSDNYLLWFLTVIFFLIIFFTLTYTIYKYREPQFISSK